MKYTEVGTGEYDSYDPDGRAIDRYVTQALSRTDTFGDAVARLILKERGGQAYDFVPTTVTILMTTEDCWSGYSEYTVTNQWSEITIGVPEWNFERHYESMPVFFRALADADDRAPH